MVLSCLLCVRSGVPLITFVQGYEADLKAIEIKRRLGSYPIPGFLSAIFALQDLIIFRMSDRILCVSLGLADYAKGLLGIKSDNEKVQFVPISVHYAEQISSDMVSWANRELYLKTKGLSEKLFMIVVIGVGTTKGTEIALQILQQIVIQHPNSLIMSSRKQNNQLKIQRNGQENETGKKYVFLGKTAKRKSCCVDIFELTSTFNLFFRGI